MERGASRARGVRLPADPLETLRQSAPASCGAQIEVGAGSMQQADELGVGVKHPIDATALVPAAQSDVLPLLAKTAMSFPVE